MGLSLDIDHVILQQTKFDGNIPRTLLPNEIAQIAGRAGRFKKNGTFGTINDKIKFTKNIIDKVENHDFPSLSQIWWRNSKLDFNSISGLIDSLEKPSPSKLLKKKGNALDLVPLLTIYKEGFLSKDTQNYETISLLWEICQMPDFGNIFSNRHITLLKFIYNFEKW